MNELAVTSDVQVVAQTPDEMKVANQALIAWCDQKIRELRAQQVELSEAALHAKKMKWQWKTLYKNSELVAKRMIYFGKMRQALKEGFFIVPNFPVNVFAVRTKRGLPLKMWSTDYNYNYQPTRVKQQPSETLVAGEGEYQNPFPMVAYNTEVVTTPEGKKQRNWQSWATDYQEIEFPLCMARPVIMQATTNAMAMKLFDDFGLFQGHTKLRPARIERKVTTDPIIVARLKDPRSTTYGWKGVSFIVAWHLDTAIL